MGHIGRGRWDFGPADPYYTEVDTYADLPTSNISAGDIYIVKTATGILPRRRSGLWRYNGSSWVRLGTNVFGAMTIGSITDGTASWQGNDLLGFHTISGNSFTDGTATLSSGNLVTSGNIGCDGQDFGGIDAFDLTGTYLHIDAGDGVGRLAVEGGTAVINMAERDGANDEKLFNIALLGGDTAGVFKMYSSNNDLSSKDVVLEVDMTDGATTLGPGTNQLVLNATGNVSMSGDCSITGNLLVDGGSIGITGNPDSIKLFSGRVGIRATPSYPLYVPWVSGDTSHTSYFGDPNANRIAVYVETGNYTALYSRSDWIAIYGRDFRSGNDGKAGYFQTANGLSLYCLRENTTTGGLQTLIQFERSVLNGAGVNGIGVSQDFVLETTNGPSVQAGLFNCLFTDATKDSEDSAFTWWLRTGGAAAAEVMRIDGNGNLTVTGDFVVDGGSIGVTGDTDLLGLAADALTVNGTATVTSLTDGTATLTGGALTCGEIKLSTQDYIGWWDGTRKSYIQASDSSLDLMLYAADMLDLRSASTTRIRPSGDTDDGFEFTTVTHVPTITAYGGSIIKVDETLQITGNIGGDGLDFGGIDAAGHGSAFDLTGTYLHIDAGTGVGRIAIEGNTCLLNWGERDASANNHLLGMVLGGGNYLIRVSNDNLSTKFDPFKISLATGAVYLPTVYDDDIGTERDLLIQADGQLGYDSSGRDTKENIVPLPDAVSEKIYDLLPRQFDKIDGPKNRFGLIADEVASVFPQCVSYKREPVYDTQPGFYKEEEVYIKEYLLTDIPETVNKRELIVPMLQELQKLRAEVVLLKTRVEVLENRS